MARPRVLTLDSIRYTLLEGTSIARRTLVGYPDPIPPSGQPSEANYLPHRFVSQRAPLGIGLKNTYDANRVWDMEADARFPSGIYNPRLATTTTFPGEVAAVQFHGFAHTMGELFMFGKGTSTVITADEACLYFDGTNWADTTTKNDINDDGEGGAASGTHIVSSMVEHVGRAYQALIGTLTNNAASGNAIVKIVRSDVGSPTAWTADGFSVNVNGTDLPYGLETDGTLMYAAAWSSSTSTITIRESADDGATWTNFTASPTILSSRAPVVGNAAVMYGDGSSSTVLDYWLGTAEGLYHIDISTETFTKVVTFQHPESSYTGTLIRAGDGLLFSDGPNVFFLAWSDSRPVYRSIGPEDVDDGVPLEQAGDITWISYDNTRGEVACGKSGLAGSRNQVIYIGHLSTLLGGDTSGWRAKMGRNSTANRKSFAGIYSSETDGTNRLHFARDNGVSNDSEALYLNYISENPDVQTAATFATSGTLTTSRFNGFSPLFPKGFFKWHVRADDLTSGETLGVKFATDSGSLGSSQSLTSGTVNSIWTDGSTTAVGSDAFDIYTEITMASDANGDTPKMRSFGYSYLVSALNSDSSVLEQWEFTIDLTATARGNPNLKGIEDVKANLKATMAKRTVVTLEYGPETNGVSEKVKILEPMVMEEEPQQADPLGTQAQMPATVQVICSDVGVK